MTHIDFVVVPEGHNIIWNGQIVLRSVISGDAQFGLKLFYGFRAAPQRVYLLAFHIKLYIRGTGAR